MMQVKVWHFVKLMLMESNELKDLFLHRDDRQD
jgi:hypothetical protein